MPSHTFLLTRPGAATREDLPEYKQESTPPAYVGSHGTRLSMILEMEDEDEEELLLSAQPSFWSSLEMKKLLSVEYATMVPQALLVDASSTLCAYLYFTSLQARMALQHQASLDVLSTICASMPDDADATLLNTCATAISQYQSTASLAFDGASHHLALALVLAKAVFGFVVMQYASRYVRPFDYLVASGAAHCLMLYCLFFVPVANLLDGTSISGAAIWIRVLAKFFWLFMACAALAIVHHLARSAFSSSRSIALKEEDIDDSMDEKSALEVV